MKTIRSCFTETADPRSEHGKPDIGTDVYMCVRDAHMIENNQITDT